MGVHQDIAIDGDDDVVFHRAIHVGEITDLGIGADPPAVDDQFEIDLRQLRHHLLDDLAARVIGTVQSEYHLISGVVLLADGAQAFIQSPRCTVYGHHQRGRRGKLGGDGTALAEPAGPRDGQ